MNLLLRTTSVKNIVPSISKTTFSSKPGQVCRTLNLEEAKSLYFNRWSKEPSMAQRALQWHKGFKITLGTPRGSWLAQRARNSPECPTWKKEPRINSKGTKNYIWTFLKLTFWGHFYHYDDGRRSLPRAVSLHLSKLKVIGGKCCLLYTSDAADE